VVFLFWVPAHFVRLVALLFIARSAGKTAALLVHLIFPVHTYYYRALGYSKITVSISSSSFSILPSTYPRRGALLHAYSASILSCCPDSQEAFCNCVRQQPGRGPRGAGFLGLGTLHGGSDQVQSSGLSGSPHTSKESPSRGKIAGSLARSI